MADPVAVPCPKNVWTKVATNVTIGTFVKVSLAPELYRMTYVMTTGTKPADTDMSNAAVMQNIQPISFAAGVDIYINPTAKDGAISRWV